MLGKLRQELSSGERPEIWCGRKKGRGEFQALGVAERWGILQYNLLAMCNPFHGHAWLIVPFLRTARKKNINSTE